METGINPLAATIYPNEKTHYLNILHAWWPGGLIMGGLAVKYIGKGIDFGFTQVPGLELHFEGFAFMAARSLSAFSSRA